MLDIIHKYMSLHLEVCWRNATTKHEHVSVNKQTYGKKSQDTLHQPSLGP
jgi:hypothetical protein